MRRAAEERKRTEFAQAQHQLAVIEQHLHAAQRLLREQERARARTQVIAALEACIASLKTAIAPAALERDAVRHDLEIAMRDRKAIELLKERRMAEYTARAARIEEEELDEANLQ